MAHRYPLTMLGDPSPAREQLVINIYLKEVRRQCRTALRELAIVMTESDPSNPHDERVWASFQAALVAAAVVSRLLTGRVRGGASKEARDFARGRAQYLRAILQVEDDAAILDPTVRDDLEHFDERLDELLRDPSVGFYFDTLVTNGLRPATPRGPGYSGADPVPILRAVDPLRGYATFQDHVFDLFELRHDLTRIEAAAQQLVAEQLPVTQKKVRVSVRFDGYERRAADGRVIEGDPYAQPESADAEHGDYA